MSTITAVPFPKTELVTFRSLDKEEYLKLKPLLDQQGWTLPYPEMTAVIVAEYQGEIVGFGVTQLVPHAEPMWVHPDWRNTGLAVMLNQKLVTLMESSGLKAWIIVAPSAALAMYCRKMGLKEVPGTIFVKE